jgi:hypothetical protein
MNSESEEGRWSDAWKLKNEIVCIRNKINIVYKYVQNFTGLWLGYWSDGRDSIPREGRDFTPSTPALVPTHPPIQWIPWVISLGIKRPELESDHSPPFSAEVKNAWNYTFIPSYVFMGCCLVNHRDNFTLRSAQRRLRWGVMIAVPRIRTPVTEEGWYTAWWEGAATPGCREGWRSMSNPCGVPPSPKPTPTTFQVRKPQVAQEALSKGSCTPLPHVGRHIP